MPNERENYVGIVKRGPKEEWSGYLRGEYEFSMAICQSLASDIEVFVNEARGELKEGQLFYRAVKSDIPPGVKTDEMSADDIARTLEMSSFLVREYLYIYEEFNGGDGNAK